jgi:hypothetical protein
MFPILPSPVVKEGISCRSSWTEGVAQSVAHKRFDHGGAAGFNEKPPP